MGYLTNALLVVLCVSALIYIGGVSLNQANPDNNYSLVDCDDLISSKLGVCGGTPETNELNVEDPASLLITPETSPNDPLSSFVTNIVNVITSTWNWITSPLSFGYSMLKTATGTPAMAMQNAGIPPGIIFVIGGVIIGMLLFWFVDWIKGGQA